jgi:hypothetical protein
MHLNVCIDIYVGLYFKDEKKCFQFVKKGILRASRFFSDKSCTQAGPVCTARFLSLVAMSSLPTQRSLEN